LGLPLVLSVDLGQFLRIPTPRQLLAAGHEIATIEGDPHSSRITIIDGAHRATIEEDARIRAGILPGLLKFRVEAPGRLPATVELRTTTQKWTLTKSCFGTFASLA